ncbi:hypothetical protein [Brevibacterium ravenspurgense]|uniref:hypothetical protein n=1 Tax=Brevibacterium ravenspurgense TaxID=479117 RepID=UPI0011AE27E3|nr:hypothetical protein [Brevibacterium ravenspurgense]
MFLLAVQRGHEDGIHNQSAKKESEQILKNVEKAYRHILCGLENHNSKTYVLSGSQAVSCLQLTKKQDANNFAYSKGDWAIAAGYDCASKLVDSVHRVAGRVIYEKPVWGLYAAIRGNAYSGRITAWNTVPTIEAIYYGQTPRFTFVSNRPLLVALALSGGEAKAVELNRNFITEYILYGYSMTSQSPYEDVYILESTKALEIYNGEIEKAEYPIGLKSRLKFNHTAADAGTELKNSLQNAMSRVSEQVRGSRIQLRLSGGKDSRALLSLLKQSGSNAYGVTFGRPHDEEVLISKYFADAAGVHLSAKCTNRGRWLSLCVAVA